MENPVSVDDGGLPKLGVQEHAGIEQFNEQMKLEAKFLSNDPAGLTGGVSNDVCGGKEIDETGGHEVKDDEEEGNEEEEDDDADDEGQEDEAKRRPTQEHTGGTSEGSPVGATNNNVGQHLPQQAMPTPFPPGPPAMIHFAPGPYGYPPYAYYPPPVGATPFIPQPPPYIGASSDESQGGVLGNTGYSDASNVNDPIPDTRRNRGGVTEPFPEKLHRMLDYAEREGIADVVSFFAHGRAFAIHKPRRFVAEIMPKFFRQTRLTSFQRQLNLYGFRRISQGPDNGGYYHELFLKGRQGLCVNMKRTKVKGTSKLKRDPESEPNFYAMRPVGSTSADVTPPQAAAAAAVAQATAWAGAAAAANQGGFRPPNFPPYPHTSPLAAVQGHTSPLAAAQTGTPAYPHPHPPYPYPFPPTMYGWVAQPPQLQQLGQPGAPLPSIVNPTAAASSMTTPVATSTNNHNAQVPSDSNNTIAANVVKDSTAPQQPAGGQITAPQNWNTSSQTQATTSASTNQVTTPQNWNSSSQTEATDGASTNQVASPQNWNASSQTQAASNASINQVTAPQPWNASSQTQATSTNQVAIPQNWNTSMQTPQATRVSTNQSSSQHNNNNNRMAEV